MNLEHAREIMYKKRDEGTRTLNEYNAVRRFLDEVYEEGYKITYSPTFETGLIGKNRGK